MALLGEAGKAIPGAYQPGTGTIISITAATAYAKPDNPKYGPKVYIHGGLADKTCQYKLNTKYKRGDRVKFTFVKAMNPELGCEWAAIDLYKIEGKPDDGELAIAQGSTGFKNGDGNVGGLGGRPNVPPGFKQSDRAGSLQYIGPTTVHKWKGHIDFSDDAFAFIQLDPPNDGRAYMDERSVTGNFRDENGVFSLAKYFKKGTRVVCDLYPQKQRKGCRYFARNVVAESGRPRGDVASSYADTNSDRSLLGDFSTSSQSLFDTVPNNFEVKYSSARQSPVITNGDIPSLPSAASDNISRDVSAKPPFVDSSTQTDPPVESIFLEKIFADEEIFRQICTRQPAVTYSYMLCCNNFF